MEKQYPEWIRRSAKQVLKKERTEEEICEIIWKLYDDSQNKFWEGIRKRKENK